MLIQPDDESRGASTSGQGRPDRPGSGAGGDDLGAEVLTARVTELEAKLGVPPKTPDNSSLPPLKGRKPSAPAAPKPKAQSYAGAHRPGSASSVSKGAGLGPFDLEL